MKHAISILAVVGGAVFVAGAPGPKPTPPKEDFGPITDVQLRDATNNLKQIALAWHNFEAVNGHFPSNQVDGTGKPLLSWRVQILPYIEEDRLYKQFKLNEPWDSEHNKKLIDQMPKLYTPIRGKAEAGKTFYQCFTGKNGLIKSGQVTRLLSVTDGTSNTFLAVEAAKPVTWTKPDDLVFDGKVVPDLGGMFNGRFHAAYCDGSVYRFRKGVDPKILGLLIDPNDGNVIPDLKDSLDKE
jgi:hypothetical protein